MRASQLSGVATWIRPQFVLSAIRGHLRLDHTTGRLDELEEMARDFVALRRIKERHNWRSESRYRRLQMLGTVALIGDRDVRRLVEALTAMEPPSQNALAALMDRLTVLRYERFLTSGAADR